MAFRRRLSQIPTDGVLGEPKLDTERLHHDAAISAEQVENERLVLLGEHNYPARYAFETLAGLLDDASPDERIRAETEEETGFRVREVRRIFEAFMSPGSVTERLFFFVGAYRPDDRVADGGGHASEGDDIDVLELGIDDALTMIDSGAIGDGKTIMLLPYAALHVFKTAARGRSTQFEVATAAR